MCQNINSPYFQIEPIMNCLQSVELINSFTTFPLTASLKGQDKRQTLEQQQSLNFPNELKNYIDQVCPAEATTINGVGHPIDLLSIEQLSWQMNGFNFDLASLTAIKTWQENWFLIAIEGGEPIIVDLNDREDNSPVYSAMQTNTGWDFAQVADSIGQFLLAAKAIEHAMNFPNIAEPLDEDFNLAAPAANWLFPLLKAQLANHYDEWASVFENYLD